MPKPYQSRAEYYYGALTEGYDGELPKPQSREDYYLLKLIEKMGNINSQSVMTPRGSVTFATLPSPDQAELGDYYNVSDSFTTTSDFIEGAGHKNEAGTNVGLVLDSDGNKKWDCFGMNAMTMEIMDNNTGLRQNTSGIRIWPAGTIATDLPENQPPGNGYVAIALDTHYSDTSYPAGSFIKTLLFKSYGMNVWLSQSHPGGHEAYVEILGSDGRPPVANTAIRLNKPVAINGVSFDGSSDIRIPTGLTEVNGMSFELEKRYTTLIPNTAYANEIKCYRVDLCGYPSQPDSKMTDQNLLKLEIDIHTISATFTNGVILGYTGFYWWDSKTYRKYVKSINAPSKDDYHDYFITILYAPSTIKTIPCSCEHGYAGIVVLTPNNLGKATPTQCTIAFYPSDSFVPGDTIHCEFLDIESDIATETAEPTADSPIVR